ncbi:MAG: outer membrane beta-barrel protein [Bacteroidales bacterium]|jgi:opacity protein-like surface antigen
MKKIIAIVIFCSMLGVTHLFGQQGVGQLAFNYDMSFGTGNLGEYISAGSFRGMSVQYRYSATDNLLVGFDLGWNVFYEKKEYDTYTVGTQSLSGVQYRYQNQVPLLFTVDYMFMADSDFRPYIGLGIGTMYSERSTQMGIWTLEEDPWQFALKPEFGMLYAVTPGTGLKLGFKYYTGMGGELDTQGYFTISVGMAFIIN